MKVDINIKPENKFDKVILLIFKLIISIFGIIYIIILTLQILGLIK